jgi:hypothetical protein
MLIPFQEVCRQLVVGELQIQAGDPVQGYGVLHDRFVATTLENDPGDERAVLVEHEGVFYALLLADGVVHVRRLVLPVDLGVSTPAPAEVALTDTID